MCSGLLNKSVVNIRRFGKAGRLSAINDSEKRWQVISLGSTQFLYALDFAFTPEINGQNLAFQVQPFLYDLQLLKRFSANRNDSEDVGFSSRIYDSRTFPGEYGRQQAQVQ